jgi:5'-3' exonuclease
MNQMEQLSEEDQYTLHQHVEQLRRQAWKPSPDYIYMVKEWLKEEGCYQYQAAEEADTLLMDLEKEHIVELVISNDSDLLVLGSACLLRIYDWEEGGLFDKKRICSKLGLSLCQWNDFMSLCRIMEHPDIHIAYSLIRVYRNLETALQKQNQLSTDIINNISII